MHNIKISTQRKWLAFLASVLFLYYQYMIQVSPSTMVDVLSLSLGVDIVTIGKIKAIYFYSFSLTLIPAGLLLDSYNTRDVLLMSVLVCTLGTFLFALSKNVEFAEFSRFLSGIGAAFSFIGSLKIAQKWFSSERVGFLSGLSILFAMLGAISADHIFVRIVKYYDWRLVMMFLTVVGIFIAAFIYLTVPLVKQKEGDFLKFNINNVGKAISNVLKNKSNWPIFIYASMIYSPLPPFAGMWSIPYFNNAFGFSTVDAANVTAMIWVGMAIGCPLIGYFSDKLDNRKDLMSVSAFIAFIIMAILYFIETINVPVAACLLFFLGLSCSGYSLSFPLTKEVNHKNISGIATAFVTTMVMAFVPIITQLVGYVLKKTAFIRSGLKGGHYVIHDYKNSVLVILVSLLISIVTSRMLPSPARNQQ